MYTVTVLRAFPARHYLTVPDPGPEGEVHAHEYEVELAFRGPDLDEHAYLVDIDDVDAALDDLEDRYADELLNDLPEFAGYNPSVERFARVVWERVLESIDADGVAELAVTVWEDETAAATYDATVG